MTATSRPDLSSSALQLCASDVGNDFPCWAWKAPRCHWSSAGKNVNERMLSLRYIGSRYGKTSSSRSRMCPSASIISMPASVMSPPTPVVLLDLFGGSGPLLPINPRRAVHHVSAIHIDGLPRDEVAVRRAQEH